MPNFRNHRRYVIVAVFTTVSSVTVDLASAQTKTYTLSSEFEGGISHNLNSATETDQLQINDWEQTSTSDPAVLPYLWAALSGRSTVIRVATSTWDPLTGESVNVGQILGEYYTAPSGCQDSRPSRTTVDFDGSVWVGNRANVPCTSGFPNCGHVVKIGNGIGFQWIDRNNNGKLDTSQGYGDIRAWRNPYEMCDAQAIDFATDELILLYVPVPALGVRTMAVDRANNLWVGGSENRRHGLLDGRTGRIKPGPGGTFPGFLCGGYGGVVDANGILWSARGNAWDETPLDLLLRYDPSQDSHTCISVTESYGLAIDSAGYVWNSQYAEHTITKLESDDEIPSIWTYPTGGNESRGVVVTPSDNHVWIADSASNTVTRLNNSGALEATIGLMFEGVQGLVPTGVAVDSSGKVWVSNRDTLNGTATAGNLMRINPITNEVDIRVPLDKEPYPDGANGKAARPYNYSDMTGVNLYHTISPAGVWTAVYDGGVYAIDAPDRPWQVTWNSAPAEGTVIVQARAADVESDLGKQVYVTMNSGAPYDNADSCAACRDDLIPCLVYGRHVQVRVHLVASSHSSIWPTLQDLTVELLPSGSVEDCNFDGLPEDCDEQEDCNTNGIPDVCDLFAGTSNDADGNGRPDECDVEDNPTSFDDCDSNGIPDLCEVHCGSAGGYCATAYPNDCGTRPDCNNNGSPDDDPLCEPQDDCNGNAILDICELFDGSGCDADGNGVLDQCVACCLGSCANLTYTECTAQGGIPAGPGVCVQDETCSESGCCNGWVCSDVYGFECKRAGGKFLQYVCQTYSCGSGVCCQSDTCTVVDGNPSYYCPLPAVFRPGISSCAPDPCNEDRGIVFVKDDVAQSGDGKSWATAFRRLQDALAYVSDPANESREIWVADGTYKPDEGAYRLDGDLDATFLLSGCLRVYGGFAGDEGNRLECAGGDNDGQWCENNSYCPGGTCQDTRMGSCSGGANAGDRCWLASDCRENEASVGVCGGLNRSVLTGDYSPAPVSNCCTDHAPALGCDDASCEAAVCDLYGDFWDCCIGPDPAWDAACAEQARTVCGGLCDITGQEVNANHVVTFSGGSAVLDGFTITDGKALAELDDSGGGVHVAGGSPTLRNCTIKGNTALASGGGVFIDSADVSVRNCELIGNEATSGGGLYMTGDDNWVHLVESDFVRNTTSAGGVPGEGGAGIYQDAGGLILDHCDVSSNTSQGNGGGLYSENGNATGINSALVFNQGVLGGGIYSGGGQPVFAGCTIFGNIASEEGAAIYHIAPDSNWSLWVINSIIWGNLSIYYGQEEQSRGFSVIKNSCIDKEYPNLSPNAGNTNLLPLLNTTTSVPMSKSPCIDSGDADNVPPDWQDLNGDGDTTDIPWDLARQPRFYDVQCGDPPCVDMGAYEYQGEHTTHHVDGQSPGGDGSDWANAYNDLQSALFSAQAGDMIWVAEGVYRPHDCSLSCDRTATFALKDGVAVYGGFPSGGGDFADRNPALHVTVLSGDLLDDDESAQGGIADNSFHVVSADGVGTSALLDGVTITAGNASAASGSDGTGGGVYLHASDPKFANCIVRGNRAALYGGGIYSAYSNPTLVNCLISGNQSDFDAGGVYSRHGSLQCVNCTVSQNAAISLGGGFSTYEAVTVLRNCIVWGNSDSTGTGDSAQLDMSNAAVTNSCIQDDVQDNVAYPGAGNIDQDPQFVDPDGLDDILGTADDDLRLAPTSPCLEVADNLDLVWWSLEDLDANKRTLDKDGDGMVTVDMGAYEFDCTAVGSPGPDPELASGANGTRNRYVSFALGNPGQSTGLRVTFASLPPGLEAFEGEQMWVGAPIRVSEASGSAGDTGLPTFWAAPLHCDPASAHFMDWSTIDILNVYDRNIIPSSSLINPTVFEVQAVYDGCAVVDEGNFSAPLRVTMSKWGDVVSNCSTNPCGAPQGSVDFDDVSSVVAKFRDLPGAPAKSRADVFPANASPDRIVNFEDISIVLDAFRGLTYPFNSLMECP